MAWLWPSHCDRRVDGRFTNRKGERKRRTFGKVNDNDGEASTRLAVDGAMLNMERKMHTSNKIEARSDENQYQPKIIWSKSHSPFPNLLSLPALASQ
jgi:hypothetical protein